MVVTLLLAGCPFVDFGFDNDDDGSTNYGSRPVYLSYEDLRNSINVLEPRNIEEIGRLYLYSSYIFLNEKNKGIHVFDNSSPATPTNIGFINIPGNTEVSIRANYLYADSYVDLVTLDLNDPANIQEVDRQEGIFPWNPRQNIPDDVFLDSLQLDETIGVVIGYE